MGDAGRDVDRLVGAELAGLDDGASAPDPSISGRTSTSATQRPAGRHDPQVVLAAMEVEAAEDAGRRGRQVGLDEVRGGEVRRPPQLAERAASVGVADDGSVADAGQCRRHAGARSARSCPAPGGAEQRRRVVGHRVRPRPQRLAGRQRGLGEDAPAGDARRPGPGRRRGRPRSRRRARPGRPRSAPTATVSRTAR